MPKITKDQIYKMIRKARRELDPKQPTPKVHRTSKRDHAQRKKNTVRREDYE
jgi:hypothetical protein